MPFLRIACFVLISLLCVEPALAQQKLPVEVSRVNFNSSTGPYKWNNVVIQLQANQNPDPQAPNPRYVDDITTTLTIGYETKGGSGFTFYQAEATLVTLETGKKKEIAFWIPEAVVKRDKLPKEPKYWLIELEVAGQQLDLLEANKKSFSTGFSGRSSIEGFKSKASGELSKTEGILVPTYLSPNPYADTREPAAFIRKEQK